SLPHATSGSATRQSETAMRVKKRMVSLKIGRWGRELKVDGGWCNGARAECRDELQADREILDREPGGVEEGDSIGGGTSRRLTGQHVSQLRDALARHEPR